jgi:hypothetical protein
MTNQIFDDFTTALLQAGFSLGGGNPENIFSLYAHNNDEIYNFSDNPWHTGDPQTDPWEWRMRVLNECDDIAYAKLFFRKSGFITREWYPYFLAARRAGRLLEDDYWDGSLSHGARRIYDAISEHERLPLHEIKRKAQFGKEETSGFEKALVDLQMKMYITMCGRQQKIAASGSQYGWSSTVFCPAEKFFDADVFERAAAVSAQEAVEKITAQVLRLTPAANSKQILKFIMG